MKSPVELRLNDRVLVTLTSNVVRSAVFLGERPSPLNPDQDGFLLGLTSGNEVVEWVNKGYIKTLEVTSRGGGDSDRFQHPNSSRIWA